MELAIPFRKCAPLFMEFAIPSMDLPYIFIELATPLTIVASPSIKPASGSTKVE
jgi:hypothetical protein